jgi:hypothetical protein
MHKINKKNHENELITFTKDYKEKYRNKNDHIINKLMSFSHFFSPSNVTNIIWFNHFI